MKTVGVLLAAGSGTRTGNKTPKQILRVGAKYLFQYGLGTMLACKGLDTVLVVTSEKTRKKIESTIQKEYPKKKIVVVEGGVTRHTSIRRALSHVAENYPDCAHVLFHDAARPLTSRTLFDMVLQNAKKYGAAIAGEHVRGLTVSTRTNVVQSVQAGLSITHMPECYTVKVLQKLYANAPHASEKTNLELMLEAKKRVHLVLSDEFNLKVTFPKDIPLATLLLRARQP